MRKDLKLIVYLEHSLYIQETIQDDTELDLLVGNIRQYHEKKDNLTDKIDFIICVGGDGTLLFANKLFQDSMPPIIAFHLGSLGFLTPFDFDNFKEHIQTALKGKACLTLRSRLICSIIKNINPRSEKELKSQNADPPAFEHLTRKPIAVLNDVVIDRGTSPFLISINLFFDDKYITTVQGDGLIIATPTGSTAYSVCAGSAMVHPNVSAIIITPICSHSLSFRPIIVPPGIELQVALAEDSKSTAWVAFDGKHKKELNMDETLIIRMSVHPLPSVSAQDQVSDWFVSLGECLHWNIRKRQRSTDSLSYVSTVCDVATKTDNSTMNYFDLDEIDN